MKLRTRRILFWSLIPCFVVGGTGIVLYSQGYRLDSETREITKVGALYVRGYPRDAKVTLDGQPLDTASWWPLQSGTLLGNLVPGRYRLHAEAPGYQDWDADVVVRATLVSERKSLTLFPAEAETVSSTAAGATRIDVPASLSGIVLAGAGQTYVDDVVLPGTYVGSERGMVVTRASSTRGTTVRVQSPDASGSATTFTVSGEILGAQEGAVLVREKPTLVVAYDVTTGRRSPLASSTDGTAVSSVLRTGSHDAWAEGAVLAVRPRGSSGEPLLVTFPADIVSIQPSSSRLGVLDAGGSLWLVDAGNGGRAEVGHRAAWAAWNPDGTAVLAHVDGGLEVIPLKSGIAHGVLRDIFSGKASELGNVRWYPDDEHIFVELGDELAFVDIINGDEAEQHAYRIPRPQDWAFDSENLVLYTLDGEGQLSSYQLPD